MCGKGGQIYKSILANRVTVSLYTSKPETGALSAQALFGNNAWALGKEQGCLYEVDPAGGFSPRAGAPLAPAPRREGEEGGAAPAFLQFSGKFWSCYTRLAAGLPEVSRGELSAPVFRLYILVWVDQASSVLYTFQA